MVNYIWNIRHLDCEVSVDKLKDVVVNVEWVCNGIAEPFNGFNPKGLKTGTCALPAPSSDEFIPYTDLTKEQVLDWIWNNGVDKAAVEAEIFRKIRPLPWA